MYRCAVPSLVVDASDDARAVSFLNSVEFDTVDPKSWKHSVLPVSHATRLTCITANVLTMQETRSMPSASVVATSLDAELAYSSSSRWPVLRS